MRTGVLAAVGALVLGCLGQAAAAAPRAADFHQQRPHWVRCAAPDLPDPARCAAVTVPLDYTRPDGPTISVAISRIPATDPAHRRGVLVLNPGGPGAPGLDTAAQLGSGIAPAIRARYDLVGFDPRGVGRSAPLRCGWPPGVQMMFRSAGFDVAAFGRDVALAAELAARCRAAGGPELRHITTRDMARDLDVIRTALGERTISFLGVSAGSYLGAVYAQLFPRGVDRMVLDSALDPARYWTGTVADMGATGEAALDDWAAWTAARDGVYHLGRTAARVRALVEDLIRHAARTPVTVAGATYDEHTLPVVLFALLDSPEHNAMLAVQVRQLAAAAAGQPVRPRPGQWPPPDGDDSVVAAIVCNDAPAPRNPLWYWANIERSRRTEPVFGPLVNNIEPCAFWPAPLEPPTVIDNPARALILQATADPRTSYVEGVALHRALPLSRLITVRRLRVHGIVGPDEGPCVADYLVGYLADGVFPAADASC